jgi:hypothetical protein
MRTLQISKTIWFISLMITSFLSACASKDVAARIPASAPRFDASRDCQLPTPIPVPRGNLIKTGFKVRNAKFDRAPVFAENGAESENLTVTGFEILTEAAGVAQPHTFQLGLQVATANDTKVIGFPTIAPADYDGEGSLGSLVKPGSTNTVYHTRWQKPNTGSFYEASAVVQDQKIVSLKLTVPGDTSHSDQTLCLQSGEI